MSAFCFRDFCGKIYKEERNIKNLLAFNTALVDLDFDIDNYKSSNQYFDLMSLLISGFIKYNDEIFDFSSILTNEEKNTKIESVYLITVAVLISLEIKENANFYRCLRNNEMNAKYLLDNIKEMLNNYIDEDFDIPNDLFSLLFKESREAFGIISNSSALIKDTN